MRRMGSCPCKQPGRPIARLRPNPSGKRLVGRSAALRRWWIAGLSTAHRALQPIPTRCLRDSKKTLNTFSSTAHAVGRPENLARYNALPGRTCGYLAKPAPYQNQNLLPAPSPGHVRWHCAGFWRDQIQCACSDCNNNLSLSFIRLPRL